MYEVTYGTVHIATFRSLKQVNAYVARITAEQGLKGELFEVRKTTQVDGNEWVNAAFR